MQYFDFSNLIRKYYSEIKLIIPSAGYWDDKGIWVEGTPSEMILEGAVISYKDIKVYRSEGTLTAKDKRLFMLTELDRGLHGSKVIYDGDLYSINDCSENNKFTGVWAYTLKYISAFKQTSEDFDLTGAIDKLEKRLDGELDD